MIIYKIEADFGNVNGSWDWETIYDPENIDISNGDYLYNISLEIKTGSAGSLTFTVPVNNPNYSRYRVLGVTVRVKANDDTIWLGRILSIKRDFMRNMSITCEGGLSFLNDILVRPMTYFHTAQSEDEGWDGKMVLVVDPQYGNVFANDIMTSYNRYCSAKRHVTWGGYSLGLYCMDTAQFSSIDGYNTTISELNKIISSDSCAVLDWFVVNNNLYGMCLSVKVIDITQTFIAGTGTITLTQNLTDYSTDTDGGDIFTQITPMDKNKQCLSTQSSDPTVPDDSIAGLLRNIYGNIEKVYNISEEVTSAQLYTLGVAVMDEEDSKNTTAPSELSINAVDMGLTEEGSGMILPGQSYVITSAYHGLSGTYNCVGMKVNIDNPGDATYNFILPSAGNKLKDRQLSSMAYQKDDGYITSSSSKYDDEAPERLVKIDDNHIAAVMGDRTEHYVIDKFATDTVVIGGEDEDQYHYHLNIYDTSTPSNIPSG